MYASSALQSKSNALCLGYDYNPEDKSITINEAEAETVRLIYDLYLQRYGAYRIAKNHHEAIISEEEWDKVQDILKSRYRTNENVSDAERIKFARKYAFSSMCQCGFCGTNLTRRSHNQDTKHKKPVWKCRTATNKGIANCPHSKVVDEVVIENAFLEMFKLLAENFDDILESVLSSVEETLSKDDNTEKLKRIEKEISSLEKKKN